MPVAVFYSALPAISSGKITQRPVGQSSLEGEAHMKPGIRQYGIVVTLFLGGICLANPPIEEQNKPTRLGVSTETRSSSVVSVDREAGDVQVGLQRPHDGLARLNQDSFAGEWAPRHWERPQSDAAAGIEPVGRKGKRRVA
jgi:hypothetical protein